MRRGLQVFLSRLTKRLALAVAVLVLVAGFAPRAWADPNQGPGGPILVVTSSTSPFSRYYAEILRAEGLNAFAVADVAAVTSLDSYDVVILARAALSGPQLTMLTSWVNAGGKLIAMDPDPGLAGLLGLTPAGSSLSEGYLRVDNSTRVGSGIASQTLQFHGVAQRYTLNGATSLAQLYSDASTATPHPAVTLRNVGSNGGRAAAFTFDLARSIVYMRQGNPAWATQERDGVSPIRADDKFFGDAAGDPQPDWVDLSKVAIPQADEQQRFLANLILDLNRDRKPLPRFWYFPNGHKAVVLMTGDDHASGGTAGRFEEFLASSPPGCSVANWECVRGTSYIYPNTPLSDAQAAAYNTAGFEIGLHINTGCADYTPASLEDNYSTQIADWQAQFPTLPPPITQRHHCIAWSDWASGAKVQLNHGMRLDTSYYYWPPGWVNNVPGHFTGSAMPMRFADLDGSFIDVYQAVTQMTDESGQQYPYTIDTLLDRALGAEQHYGVFTVNAHTDLPTIPESTAVVASALARGVPIVSARQMLTWLDGRNSSSFGALAWNGSALSFTVVAGTGASGLQALLPRYSGNLVLSTIQRNGSSASYQVSNIKGIEYAVVSAVAGTFVATYVPDTVAPTVTGRSPASGATNVPVTSSVTATFSEALDASTVNASTFELRDGANALVPAAVSWNAATFTATLTPSAALSPSGTYTVTLRGGATDPRLKDQAGNALAANVVWSFTTAAGGGGGDGFTIWPSTATPAVASDSDSSAVELGVKFRSDVGGFITGIRFYKGSGNTGTHIGSLWNTSGQRLATATFTNETASGWQQVNFATPVAITANTVYVASYYAPNGGYAINSGYFASTGADQNMLHALQNGVSGGNGVYAYGSTSSFPNSTWQSANYWVDVVFTTSVGPDTTPPTVTAQSPASGATNVPVTSSVTATFSEALDASTVTASTFELRDGANALVPAAVSWNAATFTATLTPSAALSPSSTYTVTLHGGATDPRLKDQAGNALAANVVWPFTTAAGGGGGDGCPCTIWPGTATPGLASASDTGAVELGVKFRSDVGGFITGIRFYKGSGNTGTHIGSLWNTSGQRLATATFTNETASGWQQVNFATPVAITANTVYVASYYAPNGGYAINSGYFASTGADQNMLHALQNGVSGGNGVYAYGATSSFPSSTWQSANYWVDVVFTTSIGPDTTPPTVTITAPTSGTTFSTSTTPLNLGGTAADNVGVTQVTWSNSLGGSGTATGTTAWSVNGIVLQSGANVLTVTARDAAGNTNTDTLTVTYAPDTTPPTVTITAPTNGTTFSTSTTPLNLGGTAADNVGVTQVTWSNSLGGSGTATGTTAWSVSGIALQSGANVLTVTARDAAGNTSGDTLTVTYTADTTLPTVTGRTPASGATNVAVATSVTATFSEALDPATVNGTTFELRTSGNALVAATVSWNPATLTATLTPSSPLNPSSTYAVTLRGGATDPRLKDLAGNALAGNVVWSFTTGSGACAANPITAENCLTGNPASEWDVNGAGDSNLQGFATDISVNRGGTVFFKVKTDASSYRFDIYRMGYYGGLGARKIETVTPTAALPQNQPNCLTEAATGLIDCGNWSVSGSWAVPANAASGIYFAKLVRTDTGGASHIVFVVRDDSSTSDIVFQTSDTTWQAYNNYGGNSLYTGSPAGRAYKVSYNRPFNTRAVDNGQDWLFNAEYPMVRWLEANGYNVSYIAGVDTDRSGGRLLNHRTFLSVGHDEYWSGAQRTNVEAARDAGVNLAFFSGNEVFWKTRWEPSIDVSETPYRTLVSYKETHANAKIDPDPAWTGTWRDPRFSPPADGGRPENALTGTLFMVNDGATTGITVPAADGKMRFWRNTSIANLSAGQSATLPTGTLGYEWDVDADNGFRPAGLFRLSTTTVSGAPVLQDFGSTYGSGTATHALTLYRHASGALVFGAGTVQWAWGLDATHDRAGTPADVGMQQATVNLLADMGVQPGSLRSGLVATPASTDADAPVSTITTPIAGASVPIGQALTIAGTATDGGGGVVGGVEVSVDGGATWRPANGRENWTFSWTPAALGSVTIRTRAVDDSGNLETAGVGVTVTVVNTSGTCPCTIWPSSAVPTTITDSDTAGVELGVKFRSDVSGFITGIRFYKGSTNTGTHVANLWTTSGQRLATATFTNETASGWQQVNFATPIAITANTVYIASYHAPNGRYSGDNNYFSVSGVDRGVLHALRNGESGGNGVYTYGATSSFPVSTYQSSNYWVDVVFTQ